MIGARQPALDARPGPGAAARRAAVTAMLQARSVALVGASARPDSFGQRMVAEVARSPAAPRIHLVNPRYTEIAGLRCVPSLAELPGPVDLVLLAVPDAVLAEQLGLAARRKDRAAVIFGGAHDSAGGAPEDRHCATGWPPPPGTPGWPCAGPAAWGS